MQLNIFLYNLVLRKREPKFVLLYGHEVTSRKTNLALKFEGFMKASCKHCTLKHLRLYSDQDSNHNKNVEQKSNSEHNYYNVLGCSVHIIMK